MRVLLDTHVLLWALTDDSQLSAAARERLSDVTTTTYVSAASWCELAI